ncbi:hypothetical protein [Planomonospora parontospora]|uniref:hypothetical protein n=1 Tax=Planomonospora parontospora TaxID=58119 RepID=UPI00166FC494|nr:hypothetical protein [Planomonospora parontospora]GGL59692.1 hypothetical protein GCM10014719_71260 [Planomonospora parontospora subsp. antibiotica]GII20336.1 hypothetical protein Ppa05_70620 [Planomonospora parontospora subsp. antibiotica]
MADEAPAAGSQRAESVTHVAVLGTLAEFHAEPIPYDLAALVRMVYEQRPDLLCLDITTEQWTERAFSDLPPDYRDALIPLADQTDIVIVPVAGTRSPTEPAAPGWRGTAIRLLRRCLASLQRSARSPAAANAWHRHLLADLLYGLSALLAGRGARRAWREHTERLVARVHQAASNDPGARILVAVNVRHCHHVRRALRRLPGIRLVRHDRLAAARSAPWRQS